MIVALSFKRTIPPTRWNFFEEGPSFMDVPCNEIINIYEQSCIAMLYIPPWYRHDIVTKNKSKIV